VISYSAASDSFMPPCSHISIFCQSSLVRLAVVSAIQVAFLVRTSRAFLLPMYW